MKVHHSFCVAITFVQLCSLDKVCDVLEWIKFMGVLAEAVLFTNVDAGMNTSKPPEFF